MKDDRFRVPVETDYLTSIGRAGYAFAGAEWNAAYCCDRLDPGYIQRMRGQDALKIADDLILLVDACRDENIKRECKGVAVKFAELARVHDGLFRSTPFTAEGGAQRLGGEGETWTPERLNEAGDDFAACNIALAGFLYGILKADDADSA